MSVLPLQSPLFVGAARTRRSQGNGSRPMPQRRVTGRFPVSRCNRKLRKQDVPSRVLGSREGTPFGREDYDPELTAAIVIEPPIPPVPVTCKGTFVCGRAGIGRTARVARRTGVGRCTGCLGGTGVPRRARVGRAVRRRDGGRMAGVMASRGRISGNGRSGYRKHRTKSGEGLVEECTSCGRHRFGPFFKMLQINRCAPKPQI